MLLRRSLYRQQGIIEGGEKLLHLGEKFFPQAKVDQLSFILAAADRVLLSLRGDYHTIPLYLLRQRLIPPKK